MNGRRRRFSWLAIALIAVGTQAKAGEPTRIQLVTKIPAISLSITDASGEIAGEVDGIAADSLAGPNPGEIIRGAQLQLSIPTTEGSPTFGHLDGTGSFVTGLPVSGEDGYYTDPVPFIGPRDLDAADPPIRFTSDRSFITLGAGLLLDGVVQVDVAWITGAFTQLEEVDGVILEEYDLNRLIFGVGYHF